MEVAVISLLLPLNKHLLKEFLKFKSIAHLLNKNHASYSSTKI